MGKKRHDKCPSAQKLVRVVLWSLACSVSRDSFVFSTPGEQCHSKDELQFSYRKML